MERLESMGAKKVFVSTLFVPSLPLQGDLNTVEGKGTDAAIYVVNRWIRGIDANFLGIRRQTRFTLDMAFFVEDALDRLDANPPPGWQGRESRCTERAPASEAREGRRFGPIIDFCVSELPPEALALIESPMTRLGE